MRKSHQSWHFLCIPLRFLLYSDKMMLLLFHCVSQLLLTVLQQWLPSLLHQRTGKYDFLLCLQVDRRAPFLPVPQITTVFQMTLSTLYVHYRTILKLLLILEEAAQRTPEGRRGGHYGGRRFRITLL